MKVCGIALLVGGIAMALGFATGTLEIVAVGIFLMLFVAWLGEAGHEGDAALQAGKKAKAGSIAVLMLVATIIFVIIVLLVCLTAPPP